MKWILDDMVFDDIARVVPPGDISSWPEDELMLANTTAQSANQDPSGRRQAMLAMTSGVTGRKIIGSFSVTLNSPAGYILYNHLRARTGGTANLAEHESIAWALTDSAQDSILVSRDKHAVMLALSELGRGRVCHPYELFEYLLSKGLLDRQQFDRLKTITSNKDRSIPVPWRIRYNQASP